MASTVQIIKLPGKSKTVSDRHLAGEVFADIGRGQAVDLDAISQKGHNGGRFGRCFVRCRASQHRIRQKAPADFGQERLRAGVCRIADDGDLLRPADEALQCAKQMAKGQRLAGHAFTKDQQDGLGKGVVALLAS